VNVKQKEEFDFLANEMIKFLNKNGHPHMRIIINTTCAEIVEGCYVYKTHDYVKG